MLDTLNKYSDYIDYMREQVPNMEELATNCQDERLHARNSYFNTYVDSVLAVRRRRTSQPMYRNVDDVVGYI